MEYGKREEARVTVEVTDKFDITQSLIDFFTGVATKLESDLPATTLPPVLTVLQSFIQYL